MVTGYTARIEDGQSFEEFVWGAIEAFGSHFYIHITGYEAISYFENLPGDRQMYERLASKLIKYLE